MQEYNFFRKGFINIFQVNKMNVSQITFFKCGALIYLQQIKLILINCSMRNRQDDSIPVPFQFLKYFKKLIKTINPEAQVQQGSFRSDSKKIYYDTITSDKPFTFLENFLSELGVIQKRDIQRVQKTFQNIRKISKKLKLILDSNQDYNTEFIANLEFQLFICLDALCNQKFLEKFDEQYQIVFNHPQNFLQLIQKHKNILNYKQFKLLISPQLEKIQPSFSDYTERIKQESLNFIFDKIEKYQIIYKHFYNIQIEDIEQKINYIYENHAPSQRRYKQKRRIIQPYQKFELRVGSILKKAFNKFKAGILDSKKTCKELYKQIQTLNKANIENLLKTYKFRQLQEKNNQIPIQLIKDIYQINEKQLSGNLRANIVNLQQNKMKEGQRNINLINQQRNINLTNLDKRQEAQLLRQIDQKIRELKTQVQLIKMKTNNSTCFQIYLRELEIAVHQNNKLQIKQVCEKIQQLIKKYGLSESVKQDLKQLKFDIVKEENKLSKVLILKRNIQILNVEEILRYKAGLAAQIKQIGKDAKNGIVLIGRTGVGKSTLNVGLSGYQLLYMPDTQDFRPELPDIAKKYEISNGTLSVTKCANVSELPKEWLRKMGTSQQIVLLDLPGLDDNRSAEIDISNNLSTVQLLKGLQKRRFVIIISLKQFTDRWTEGLTQFIRSISKYLINIKDVQDSIIIILTKGLTSNKLLNQIKKFTSSETFKELKLSLNQERFLSLLKQRLPQLPKLYQIIEPDKHSYQRLAESIIQRFQPKVGNGIYVAQSFSEKTRQLLSRALSYSKHMTFNTFEYMEFSLTKFYLSRLKQIEDILGQNIKYNSCRQMLINNINKKVESVRLSLKKYIQTSLQVYLTQISSIQEFLNHPEIKIVLEYLYDNSKIIPTEQVNIIIEASIKQYVDLFDKPSKIPKDKRKKAKASLKLIQKFKSYDDYSEIITRIQNENKCIQNQLRQVLQSNNLISSDLVNLDSAINEYINQFQLNDQFIISEYANREKLTFIIHEYFEKDQPQLNQINKLIKYAQQSSLNGSLEKITSSYFGRIAKISEKHPPLKSKLGHFITDILKDLENLLVFYEKQKKKSMENINQNVIILWNIYEMNLQQIYRILEKWDHSEMRKFRSQKNEQFTIDQILKNLKKYIQKLEILMNQLSDAPQKIDPYQLDDYLKNIHSLIKFIQIKASSNHQNKEESIAKKQNQNSHHMLEHAYKIINKILGRISRISDITRIEHYEVNYKLIVNYLVLTEFNKYFKGYGQIQNFESTQKKISQKLMKPLDELIKVEFQTVHDYEKLEKVLKYMFELDKKIITYGNKMEYIESLVSFPSNIKIIHILDKCFKKTKQDLKQLKNIFDLANYDTQIKLEKQKQNSELKSQLQSQKKKNLTSLTYNLLNFAIRYIQSHRILKNITNLYSNELSIVEDFSKETSAQSDLKSNIIERIKQISNQLHSQLQIPTLTRKDISEIQIQLCFLLKINEKTNFDQYQDCFEETKTKLDKILKIYLQDFTLLLSIAQQNYKQLSDGVDFENLKQLVHHDALNDGTNLKQLTKLLQQIDKNYCKILREEWIRFDKNEEITQKTNVFLNVYEFLEICKSYPKFIDSKIDKSLLKDNLQNFFSQLQNSFDRILINSRDGKARQQYKLKQLCQYQNRILMLLKTQYEIFQEKIQIKGKLYDWFQSEYEKIQLQFQKRYIDEAKIDEKYQKIYNISSESKKKKMKESYQNKSYKKFKETQDALKNNHLEFNKLIKEKFEQFKNVPNQVCQDIKQKFQNLQLQKLKQEQAWNQSIRILIIKNPLRILDELQNIEKKNSQTMKEAAIAGIIKFYEQKYSQIDLIGNYSKTDQILNQVVKFSTNPKYNDMKRKYTDLNSAVKQFQQALGQTFLKFTESLENDLKSYMKLSIESNSVENYKLSTHKSPPSQTLNILYQHYLLLLKYKVLFQKQFTNLKSIIESYIKVENKAFLESIQKVKEYDMKIKLKHILQRTDIIQTLRALQTHKEICIKMKRLNNQKDLIEKIEISHFELYEKVIENIKNQLKMIYNRVDNWNIDESLNNGTPERIAKRNQQIQRDLKILDNISEIFMESEEIPMQILKTIQNKNQLKVQSLENQSLEQITQNFSSELDATQQKVRKIYALYALISKSKPIIFPQNIKFFEAIQTLLLKNFTQNISVIEGVTKNPYLIQKIKNLMAQLKPQIQIQNKLFKQKKEEIDLEKKLFEQKHKQKLESQIKLIDSKELQKIEQLKIQYNGEIISKTNDLTTKLQKFRQKFQEDRKRKCEKIENEIIGIVHKEIAIPLIINRRARSIFNCEEKISKHFITIQYLLDNIVKSYSKGILRYLHSCLKDSRSIHGAMLIDEQKCFDSFKILAFIQETKGQNFQKLVYSMNDLKNDPNRITLLTHRYQQYTTQFNQIVDTFKNSTHDFESAKKQIIDRTISQGSKLLNQYQYKKMHSGVSRWKFLANVCAVWVIIKSQINQDNEVVYIHRPHPGQILSLFLLLQFEHTAQKSDISKALIQVSTGQGKSVILGILSAYLALVGFKVYEACYSQYLSQRDYQSFQSLFDHLNIKNRIVYDIFPEICKKLLDQSSDSTFTESIQSFLFVKDFWKKIKKFIWKFLPDQTKEKSILLIDEADVFLNENYLGESYYPTINLQFQSIAKLLNFVWQERENIGTLTCKSIIQSAPFKELCSQVDNKIFTQIMKNQANAMIRGLHNYKEDTYTIKDGRIFYKQGDGLSDKVHFGYRTIFSYYHQYYNNSRVTYNELNKFIAINLIVASFSYSELPVYFSTILGVTGTLESMSKGQKEILRDKFGVTRQYIQPSIYNQSRRSVMIKKCYNPRIKAQIVNNIDQQYKNKRPIIIFFKNKNEVYHFLDSIEFAKYKDMSNAITYEVHSQDRDYRIQVSTMEGKITLLTFDFSRGTDFKIIVKKGSPNLGLHVICGFLPDSYSDYIQMIGRTGRQGKNGSVMIFIPSQSEVPDNERDLSREDAQKIIKNNDNTYWSKKKMEISKKIQDAKMIHKKNQQILQNTGSVNQIFENMKQLNHQYPISIHKSRTAICIDATGSMGHVFPEVIKVIKKSIPGIYKAIQTSKIQCTFEVKLVIYRNYGSGADLLLQYTNFESKPQNLIQFLNGSKVSGGQGNEAVEVCLQYLNSIADLNQFVIIGDAIANTQSEVASKRKRTNKTESYWNANNFPITSYQEQIKKLTQKNIKGHSYYLKPHETKKFYDDLSKRTNGVSKQFLINAQNATAEFTQFVANKILVNLGEIVGGDAPKLLLQAYKNVKKYI